jgi:3-deoxy-D-manno-octulosonate 8-phosphate phosphatase (KDO 8-P phosphatase)
MDVDGTLTDGKVYMGNQGECFKAFDIKDGFAIKCLLPPYNIVPVIITARSSKIVENRCQELDILECHQNATNKYEKLTKILSDYSKKDGVEYNFSHVAYIGDDVLDLQCMTPVKATGGLVGCPSNAVKQVRDIADFISEEKGGDGAVREFVEWILERRI